MPHKCMIETTRPRALDARLRGHLVWRRCEEGVSQSPVQAKEKRSDLLPTKPRLCTRGEHSLVASEGRPPSVRRQFPAPQVQRRPSRRFHTRVALTTFLEELAQEIGGTRVTFAPQE